MEKTKTKRETETKEKEKKPEAQTLFTKLSLDQRIAILDMERNVTQ